MPSTTLSFGNITCDVDYYIEDGQPVFESAWVDGEEVQTHKLFIVVPNPSSPKPNDETLISVESYLHQQLQLKADELMEDA